MVDGSAENPRPESLWTPDSFGPYPAMHAKLDELLRVDTQARCEFTRLEEGRGGQKGSAGE
jgi:hypothetical protein